MANPNEAYYKSGASGVWNLAANWVDSDGDQFQL